MKYIFSILPVVFVATMALSACKHKHRIKDTISPKVMNAQKFTFLRDKQRLPIDTKGFSEYLRKKRNSAAKADVIDYSEIVDVDMRIIPESSQTYSGKLVQSNNDLSFSIEKYPLSEITLLYINDEELYLKYGFKHGYCFSIQKNTYRYEYEQISWSKKHALTDHRSEKYIVQRNVVENATYTRNNEIEKTEREHRTILISGKEQEQLVDHAYKYLYIAEAVLRR